MFSPSPQQIKNKRNVNDKTQLLAYKTFQYVMITTQYALTSNIWSFAILLQPSFFLSYLWTLPNADKSLVSSPINFDENLTTKDIFGSLFLELKTGVNLLLKSIHPKYFRNSIKCWLFPCFSTTDNIFYWTTLFFQITANLST